MSDETGSVSWGEHALKELLGSEVRARVISHICANADEPIIAADLVRELDASATAVSRELARLCELGMLREGNPIGRARPYYLIQDFPLLPGLRSMCMYATGVVAALRAAFADEEGIEVAFIFGSIAAGGDRPDSDVDVIVVGDIRGIDLSGVIRGVAATTGRTINPIRFLPDEFMASIEDGDGFLHRAIERPKILLRGDRDALRRLTEAGPYSRESVPA